MSTPRLFNSKGKAATNDTALMNKHSTKLCMVCCIKSKSAACSAHLQTKFDLHCCEAMFY